jgi:hypothetical protein
MMRQTPKPKPQKNLPLMNTDDTDLNSFILFLAVVPSFSRQQSLTANESGSFRSALIRVNP